VSQPLEPASGIGANNASLRAVSLHRAGTSLAGSLSAALPSTTFRVIQSSAPIRYAIVDGMNVRDSRVHNHPPRWNAAPSQDLLVIRRNHKTGEVSLDPLRWGLIPYWCEDPKGGRKPINAKCETVHSLPTFRDAYRRRRCILPVDGFFERKAIKGQKAKQPYAIAMKDGSPFAIGGLRRTGRTRHRVSGCAPSRSSRRTPTNWSPRFTTACL
jgi:putative SOS response-associated peptidase YedK